MCAIAVGEAVQCQRGRKLRLVLGQGAGMSGATSAVIKDRIRKDA